MTGDGPDLAALALARVERDDAGRLRVRGKLRRMPPNVRALAAYTLHLRRVDAVTKYGRRYTGQLIAIAETTDGNVSHVAVIDDGAGFPIALSLATIDTLAEVTR